MVRKAASTLLFLVAICVCSRFSFAFIVGNSSVSSSSHMLLVDEKIFQLDKVIKQLQSNVANVDTSIGHVQQALADKDRIIEDLENMVGEFERELRNASKRVDQLEKENDVLKALANCSNQCSAYPDLKNKSDKLDSAIKNITTELSAIKNQETMLNATELGQIAALGNCNASITSDGKRIVDIQGKIASLETLATNITMALMRNEHDFSAKMKTIEQAVKTVTGIIHRRVNFRAILTHNMKSLSGHSTISAITFDHVTENVGNCYNRTSGMFTAIYEGYYMFTAHAHAEPNKELRIVLRHNQTPIGNYFIASNVSAWQGALVASGTYMMPNDRVYVYFRGDVHGNSDIFEPPTMFSGFLAG